MSGLDSDPLAAFRGEFPRAAASARQVANTLTTPGCHRRRFLDMAEVDMRRLGIVVNNDESRMSSFAITRARTFMTNVTEPSLAVVINLARTHLGLDLRDIRQESMDSPSIKSETPTLQPDQIETVRLRRTRTLMQAMLDGTQGAINLVRNPLTTLALADRVVHLEHDVMLFASTTSKIHLVEIRDYPEIDGVLEPSKAGQTKREAAIALISIQQIVADLGGDPDMVSSQFLLITPKQLTLTPVAQVLDAGPQMMRLRMLIDRSPTTEQLAETLRDLPALPAFPGEDSTERARASAEILAAIAPLPYRLGQGCSSCVLHRTCRDQAAHDDKIQMLGPVAAQSCGSVETVAQAVNLAEGRIQPRDPGEAAVAASLDRARRSIEFAQRMIETREDTSSGTATRDAARVSETSDAGPGAGPNTHLGPEALS